MLWKKYTRYWRVFLLKLLLVFDKK
jgi:hypothetical protein